MFDEPHVWDILQAAAIENILHRSQAILLILVIKLKAYSAMGTFLIWYFLGEGLYVYISILELIHSFNFKWKHATLN
jgi:hypothetical protein